MSREYTKEGVEKLYSLACDEYYGGKCQLEYLIRNKSSSYFEDIIRNKDGVMLPYIKDSGNDQFNPMNGSLGGLFFSADEDYSEHYQSSSYFGNTRFTIPVHRLLADTNLYFADYYCLQGKTHYINIVACKPYTKSDNFCEEKLVKLSKDDNPFFVYENGCYEVISTKYLKVEIFITEPIDIKKELKASSDTFIYYGVDLAGKGSSKPGGLPKKTYCSTCNFSNVSDYIRCRSYERVLEERKCEAGDAKSFSFTVEGKYVFNHKSKGKSCWIIKEGSANDEEDSLAISLGAMGIYSIEF